MQFQRFLYTQYHFSSYPQESVPLKGGRGAASMVQKCKLCSRENSIGMNKHAICTVAERAHCTVTNRAKTQYTKPHNRKE